MKSTCSSEKPPTIPTGLSRSSSPSREPERSHSNGNLSSNHDHGACFRVGRVAAIRLVGRSAGNLFTSDLPPPTVGCGYQSGSSLRQATLAAGL